MFLLSPFKTATPTTGYGGQSVEGRDCVVVPEIGGVEVLMVDVHSHRAGPRQHVSRVIPHLYVSNDVLILSN